MGQEKIYCFHLLGLRSLGPHAASCLLVVWEIGRKQECKMNNVRSLRLRLFEPRLSELAVDHATFMSTASFQ